MYSAFWIQDRVSVRIFVFNATFKHISVVSWWTFLLVEETWVPEETYRPVESHWHNVVSSTHRHERDSNALNTNILTLTLSWIQNAEYIINSISFSGHLMHTYIYEQIIKLNTLYIAVHKRYLFFIAVSILSTIYWKK
jgi:hypothetical protein